MNLNADAIVGLIETGGATVQGWIPDGGGHRIRLSDLAPEARTVLEMAASWHEHSCRNEAPSTPCPFIDDFAEACGAFAIGIMGGR